MEMKILQVGCGSMGSRRVRDLVGRPGVDLRALDAREDRRRLVQSRFGIKTFDTLAAATDWGPAALIISSPPGTKGPPVDLALARRIHHFVEADIWSYGAADQVARSPEIIGAPSLSFLFLPVVKALIEQVPPAIGSVLGYQFFLAGDMAGWHPTEGSEYYGRHRDTAPAREMVPFELAWLSQVFGPAKKVAGGFNAFNPRAGTFEDTWSLLMDLERGGTGQLTVTLGCPHDYRRGCAFGANGSATWDINRGEIELFGPTGSTRQYGSLAQVIEAAYAAEIGAFVDAIQGGRPWPHRYADYQLALATLAAAEASARLGGWTSVQPGQEPERVLPRKRHDVSLAANRASGLRPVGRTQSHHP